MSRNKNNKNIILVSPPSKWTGARPYYPHYVEAMGISYLATVLRKQNYNTHILDMEVHDLKKIDVLNRINQIGHSILIGIAALSKVTINEAINLAYLIKNEKPKAHITFGGHLATFVHEQLLEKHNCIDTIVRGEGENTIIELAKTIEQGHPLNDIAGISFRRDGEVVVNSRRMPIENIDEFPFPNRYNLENILYSNQRIPVCSSRGCYGGCSFCTLSFFSKKWRARTAKNVVDEIENLYGKGARRIRFDDENFFGHSPEGLDRAFEFAKEIGKRNFPEPLDYKVLSRVDDLREDVLVALKKSGLDKISIGVESFNQRQLDLYNKNITLEQIQNTIDMIRRVGLKANFSFIMFDPYVTLEEVENNARFMEKLPEFFEYRRFMSKLKPDVGTILTKKIEKDGLLVQQSEFNYDFEFARPETALLYKILEQFQKRFLPIDNKIAEVKDERIDRIVYKNKNSGKRMKEKDVLKIITRAERIVYQGWVEILSHALSLSREYKKFEDIKNLFPEKIDRYFDQTENILEEARARLYKK